MAYSEKAKALRQCKALRKDGKPCQAYAVWGEDFCMAHSGRHHQGPMPHPYERRFKKRPRRPRRSPTCHCPAYNWPHTAQGVDYASGQTHQPGVVQHHPARTTGYDSADIEIKIFKK